MTRCHTLHTRLLLAALALTVLYPSVQAQQRQPRQVSVSRLPTLWVNQSIEVRTVKGAPYSADVITESIQTLSDGNRIVKRTTGRVYRDSEGRVRREETRDEQPTQISIHDPITRRVTTMDEAGRVARSNAWMPISLTYGTAGLPWRAGAEFAGQASTRAYRIERAPGELISEEAPPERTIEGVRVTGFRRTNTIPAGAIDNEQPIRIVMEEWTSPELQVLVLTEFNDPRSVKTTYRLTNIQRSEPDPALFKAPAGFRLINGPVRKW